MLFAWCDVGFFGRIDTDVVVVGGGGGGLLTVIIVICMIAEKKRSNCRCMMILTS